MSELRDLHEEVAELREFRTFIFEACFWVDINASDLWDWATADSVRIPSDDLDIFWIARQKFGREGEIAVMRLFTHFDEPPDPQEPMFDRGYISREKYAEAKAWVASIRCEWQDSDDRELRSEHIEYDKHCKFGWKIERPMYDDKEVDDDNNPKRYW